MKQTIISGIQQVGVGIPNLQEAFKWYRKTFGVDIPILDDEGTAELMLPYTGGKPQKRHAILAINIKGGGGMEIWNYTERIPQAPNFTIQLGDLGIFAAKIKTENAQKSLEELKQKNVEILSEISNTFAGRPHFFIKDPYGNVFEIIEDDVWFSHSKCLTGGPMGALIGVKDMDKSINFYKTILGFDEIVYDETAVFPDLTVLQGGSKKFRRVLLTHSDPRKGPFAELLGQGYIELFQAFDYTPIKMFDGRQWGDLGFIHLCFDVKNTDGLKEMCEKNGHPFTVDTGNSFDMGKAAGRFAYIEDPDGTLIEFVETFKIPVMQKFGIYLNLSKRNPEKPLPRYILKALKLMRVKD